MPGELRGTRFGFAVFPALASVYYEDLVHLVKIARGMDHQPAHAGDSQDVPGHFETRSIRQTQ
jgi:hypothetical protein